MLVKCNTVVGLFSCQQRPTGRGLVRCSVWIAKATWTQRPRLKLIIMCYIISHFCCSPECQAKPQKLSLLQSRRCSSPRLRRV